MAIKVGDKVKCISNNGDGHHVFGLKGVVHEILWEGRIGVDWEGLMDGHKIQGKLKTNSGWFVNEDCVQKLNTFKGNK